LQTTFFSRIGGCNNPASVTIQIPKITAFSTFTDFTGDSAEDFAKNEYVVKCLYTRNISQKDRDRYGISEEVSTRVFISPLDLKKVYGEYRFTEEIMACKNTIRCIFLGVTYEVFQIVELEPMVIQGKDVSIAIELRLKKRK
jgi:hypothetical protein